MKHKVRNRITNQYGLPVTKIENIFGELGSGVNDIHGKEIFENDVVRFEDGTTHKVYFNGGIFLVDAYFLDDCPACEIVGQVEVSS